LGQPPFYDGKLGEKRARKNGDGVFDFVGDVNAYGAKHARLP